MWRSSTKELLSLGASTMIDPDLALRIVRESPLMAYDTETSGLEPGRDFICGHVITNTEHSIYVPLRHESGGNVPDAEGFEKALASAFNDRARLGLRTVGHNLGFDLRMAAWHGITLGGPLEDTQINESLIDDRTRSYSLDSCCER